MSDILGTPYFKKDIPRDIPPFIRTSETGDRVYFVENGIVHWIKDPQTLEALGGDFGMVQMVDYMTLKKCSMGDSVDMQTVGIYKKVEKSKDSIPTEPLKTFEAPAEDPPSAPKKEPEKGFTSIIIPAYWKDYSLFHYTGNCIGSIREHTNPTETPYEIILVINGETGIKLPNYQASYADKIIPLPKNEGYGKAVNKGIRTAKGEYIAIINNDVQVYDRWLWWMQESLEFIDLVMATPMYGDPFARANEAAILEGKSVISSKNDVLKTFSSFRDFSCVLTRKKLFDEIGLFDEEFFAYKEDLDLFNRMDKVGKKYASTKLVNTFHIIGATGTTMTDDELHKEEGKRHYEEKYGKG